MRFVVFVFALLLPFVRDTPSKLRKTLRRKSLANGVILGSVVCSFHVGETT